MKENLDASLLVVLGRLAATYPKKPQPSKLRQSGFNRSWQIMMSAVEAFVYKPSAFGESKE